MKKILSIILVIILLFFAMVCCDDDEDWEDEPDDSGQHELIGTSGDPNQTWAIYWYLCGSNLESDNGAATMDLEEVMEVELPPNVKLVIQTGGSMLWQNDFVDAGRTERYVYSSNGLELVDSQPQANMGDPQTLVDFLCFCEDHYPADHTMVLFWDHGGGSVAGAGCDENYGYDAMTLSEYYQAFDAVYHLSEEAPPIDVIGFDTCLMATIDTAYTFSDVSRYLVASEELEPGCGWYYTGFLQALADDPGMDGARLGQMICDSYMDGCEMEWFGVEDEATLSVVDLSKLGPLMESYEKFGAEALRTALNDPTFFSKLARVAEDSENYGGNTRDQGYTNMVDLGDLAENCQGMLPRMYKHVLNGLDQCVLYQVQGDYRQDAQGLSCYYSYNGDVDDFYGYTMEGCSDAFKFLYYYELTGEMPQEGMDYINSLGYKKNKLPEVPTLETDGDEVYPLYTDEDNNVILELKPEIVDLLKGVYFNLSYVDLENDVAIMLGEDNDLYTDWDNGIFRDNFRGVWCALDDCPVYMEVSYEEDDYTAYTIPILLNDEEYNLRVIYDYEDEEYYILGARKGLDDDGMPDKNLVQLKPGDEITTLHYAATIEGDDEMELVPMEAMTVTEDTTFHEFDLPDGDYLMMFELVDAKNNTAFSEAVSLTLEGDTVAIEILSDDDE